MADGAENRDLVAFLTVDQRPADAIRFPGDFTQLAALGNGQAIADQWNSENLAGLLQEHDERWGNGDAAEANAASGSPGPTPGGCPRCAIGSDVAGWCTVCGLDLRPDAAHPRFFRDAQQREEAWKRTQSPELAQAFGQADSEWMRTRDSAFAATGAAQGINRLKWVSDNPRPTLEGTYQSLYGMPYPDLRPRRDGNSVAAEPATPQRPTGALVAQLESAWCATLEGSSDGDFVRVLAGPGALPRKEIAVLVAELTAEGWSIVHWSDERRVVHEDEISRTEVTGVSVVLHKSPALTP